MIFSFNFNGRNTTCRWDETAQKAYLSWYCPDKLSMFQEAEEMVSVTTFTEYMTYISDLAKELNGIALRKKELEDLEAQKAKTAASPFAKLLEVTHA